MLADIIAWVMIIIYLTGLIVVIEKFWNWMDRRANEARTNAWLKFIHDVRRKS